MIQLKKYFVSVSHENNWIKIIMNKDSLLVTTLRFWRKVCNFTSVF